MEASNLGGGQLRVGASDTICRYYLVPFLNKFHKTYPNVHIKVTNQTSTKCVDLLEMGQVDLIVTNYPNSRLSPATISGRSIRSKTASSQAPDTTKN